MPKKPNRQERLHRVAERLAGGEPTWQIAKAVALEFEISERQAWRDIKQVREDFFPALWDWRDTKAFIAQAMARLDRVTEIAIRKKDVRGAVEAIRLHTELFGVVAKELQPLAGQGEASAEDERAAYNAARRLYNMPTVSEEQWADITNTGSSRVN